MSVEEKKINRKELAKLKREAVEVASAIHDIVEDTLWVDYVKLPELSQKLVQACEIHNKFKEEKGL